MGACTTQSTEIHNHLHASKLAGAVKGYVKNDMEIERIVVFLKTVSPENFLNLYSLAQELRTAKQNNLQNVIDNLAGTLKEYVADSTEVERVINFLRTVEIKEFLNIYRFARHLKETHPNELQDIAQLAKDYFTKGSC